MALTDEDKKRLSKQDQDRIAAATAKWEQAAAAGDEAGKKAAADEAKKIREQAGYYTDSYGRYEGELPQSDPFLDGFEGKDSSSPNIQQEAGISTSRPAPTIGYDGMYSVEGGSGKSFIYDPVEKTIEVFRPDGSHDIIKKENENYDITYRAMEDDTGYDFSKAEPDWELENRRAYWDAKEELDSRKDKEVEEIMAKIDELYLQSEEKEKAAEAKTTAQNRSLYGGYMQEIDPYGEFAEKIAKKGLTKSGYPQYDYAGFRKAFEEQAGDNMQNLMQLKAEIQAALNLALATQNEKLEETLLDYQEKLARLEKEYSGKTAEERSLTDAATAAVMPNNAVATNEATEQINGILKAAEEKTEVQTKVENNSPHFSTSSKSREDVEEEAANNEDGNWAADMAAKTDNATVDKSKLSEKDIITFTDENDCDYSFYKGGNYVDIIDRETGKVLATLEKGKDFFYDEDGIPYFSKEFLESKEYSQILFDRHAGGEMDIINFAKSIGCEYKFYATYAELTDPRTGEVLMRLQKDKDYFYDKDGLPYLSMDVLFSDEYGELLERQRVSAKSSDKDIVSFVEEYNCKYRFHNGKADLIDPQTGKVIMTLTEGKDYFFGTDGLPYLSKEFISRLNSKDARGLTAQDLLERSPQTIAKRQIFEYAEKILRGDEDVTQEDLDILAENLALLEGDKKVEAALDEMLNDEEFAAAWEERLEVLDALENPQAEEDEATAVEMVGAVLLLLLTGYTYKTGNKLFDNTLSVIALLTTFTGIGKLQSLFKSFVGKKILKKALNSVSQSFTIPSRREKIIMFLDKHFESILKNESIANGIYSFISGIYAWMDLSMPQELDDYLKDIDGN